MNGVANQGELLNDGSPGADCQMTDFRVAHQSFRQPDRLGGCLQKAVGKLFEHIVVIGVFANLMALPLVSLETPQPSKTNKVTGPTAFTPVNRPPILAWVARIYPELGSKRHIY